MRSTLPTPAHKRMRRLLASVSAALLIAFVIAFHAILLWQRILDLSLFKPVPAIRWLATIALMMVLWRLHRRGVSMLRGRSALVFWLLVLLLHVGFWGPLADPSSTCDGWTGPGLLLALPAITLVLGLIFPSIRKLLARALASTGLRDLPNVAFLRESQSFVLRAGSLPILASRPPPAFSQ